MWERMWGGIVRIHAPASMSGSRQGPAVPKHPLILAGSGIGGVRVGRTMGSDSGLAILGSQLEAV